MFNLQGSPVVQYGEGACLKIFSSSLSEADSYLGVQIAQNKSLTSRYLSSLGYPFQPHATIASLDQALRFARQHFPVVVKPVGADRGEGVEVDIRTENVLQKVASKLLKKYKSVMIEKYISAIDYRLYVFQGKLIWAHRRVPPHLTGDGIKSVSKLLEAENLRRLSAGFRLKPIPEDRNFFQCLMDQGLSPDSVLPLGVRCRVGSLGLVSRGGFTEACYEEVHPDNAQLAADCCRQIGLCLGGVDLLIPDISVSWRESIAHICEINAVPQLGTLTQSHLCRLILESSLKNASIPSILIIMAAQSSLMDCISRWLSALSPRFGFRLCASSCDSDVALQPLMDRRTRSCVALLSRDEVLAIGAPLIRFDQVFVDRAIVASPGQLSCFNRYCRDSVLEEFEGEENLKRLLVPALSLLSQRQLNVDCVA